jgi:hypothetical protein
MEPTPLASYDPQTIWPLRIINLEYMGPSAGNPERAIRAVFNDGMVIVAIASGIEALMEHPQMQKYQELLGNLLYNEMEYWFADKNPYLTSKLIVE